MPAKVRAWLFPRRDEEIDVGGLPRRLRLILPVLEAERTGIVGMEVAVKITQAHNVQPERAHGREIFGLRVERTAGAESLGESQVKVVDECLVARNRREPIAMCEGKDRVSGGISPLTRDIEIHGHVLPCAGRRVVEREVLRVLRDLFAVRLAHAKGKARLAV